MLWPYLLALAAIHLVIHSLKNWQNKVKPSWSRVFDISDQCRPVVWPAWRLDRSDSMLAGLSPAIWALDDLRLRLCLCHLSVFISERG